MEDHNLTREELLEALAKSQAQVNILQKALLEDSNQASESLYKEIVEGQTDMITRWMPDTTITYVNQAYCRYFGGSTEKYLGKPFLSNLPAETQLVVKDAVAKLITGQAQSYVTEEKSLDAEGNMHWVQWTYNLLRNEAGDLAELQSVGRDITDLREARMALEQANMVVEQSPVIVFRRKVVDNMLDDILYVSRNVERYGYTAEDFTTGRVPFEQTVHPDDLQFVGETLIGNLQNNIDEYQFEYRGVFPGDVMTWFTLQATIERDKSGEAVLQTGTIIDITEIKEAQEEVADRAQALATVAEVATAVSATQDPKKVLKQVVDLTKERFGFYHAHVYELNEIGNMLELVSGAGKIGDQMVAEKRTIPFDAEQSLVAQAARSRKGVIVNDVTADPNFLPHPLLPETKAEMAVPMLSGTDVLGVLDVQAAEADRFTQDDVDVLTTLASQVAVSMLNATQYDEVRRSEELVHTVIDATPDWIFIKDLDHRYTMVNQGYANSLHIPVEDFVGKNDIELGFPEDLVKGNPEKGIRGFWADDNQVFETKEPIMIDRDIVQIDGKERVYATLKTPLMDASGRVTGVLAFGRDVTEREELLVETQSQYETSRKLNTASGYADILNTVVNMVNTEKLDRAFILGLDTNEEAEIETLHVIANWDGTGEGKVTPVGAQFPATVFPVVSLFTTPDLFVFNDFETDERLDEAMRKWLLGQGLRSGILLPLLDGDRPFAAVFLESKEIDYFTKQEERAFELAAAQLNSVVQNELLLQATSKRAQELVTVAEVSTAVSATQDPQAMLQQVVDLTKERFALYHAHVYMLNDAGDTLELRSGAGDVGRQMVAEKRSIPLAAEQSLVARAARGKEGVIVNDVQQDPNFLPHPLLPETRAEMAVPLLVGDEVLGVLDVQSERVGRFTEEDVRIKTTLASQVAVALQNARQYEEVQTAEQLTRVVLEAVPDSIFRCDANGTVVFFISGGFHVGRAGSRNCGEALYRNNASCCINGNHRSI